MIILEVLILMTDELEEIQYLKEEVYELNYRLGELYSEVDYLERQLNQAYEDIDKKCDKTCCISLKVQERLVSPIRSFNFAD